jgi:hypothetical protein
VRQDALAARLGRSDVLGRSNAQAGNERDRGGGVSASGNKPQADQPRWFTPRRVRPVQATPDYLDRLSVGAVLAVPVRFGDEDSSVTLSVVKVSAGKFGVHTRAGFPSRCLVGASVVRRVRRDVNCSEAEQSPSTATDSEVTA